MPNLIIFASGSGSNAQNVVEYFSNNPNINVKAVFCNNPNAGVIDRMKNYNIPLIVFSRDEFKNPDYFLPLIEKYEPNLIALLGFLWQIPPYFVKHFDKKIINLHPALLPKYGGKGMFGHHVHEAVKKAGDTHTGITIHWVNEEYDKGEIIFQQKTQIFSDDNPDDIAKKIALLEMTHVPEVIEKLFNIHS